jgi:hypothetical protein
MSIRPRNQIRGILLVGMGGLGDTAMNLITAIRTVIKTAAIVIFSCGVAWSMAEFDQLALEMAPTVSGNQVTPLSSCEAVFRQSDLARRLGEKFRPAFITPLVFCGAPPLIGLDPKPFAKS